MISQFILSQIKCLVALLFSPCVLPYPAASVNRRFGCRSIVINSHHVAGSISGISSRITFGRGGNNLRYSLAHGVVSEIDGGGGLNHGAHFAARRPCNAQVFVVVLHQVAYGVVFVSPSRGFML